MIKCSLFGRLRRQFDRFLPARDGNIAATFGIMLVPLMGGIAGAIDYSRANSVYSAMQAALDAAALSTVKVAAALPADQVQTTATNFFTANFNRPEAAGVNVTVQYTASTNTLTVSASGVVQSQFMQVVGVSQLTVNASSTAVMAPQTWPVCVMVTDPDSSHTLLVKNKSKIDFYNCMVQVNTQNWDAVEARDTSYIHSTNGDNCFVGDIHYGDVTPPKDATCTFFPDPYASGYAMPASASTCNYTNKTVKTNGTVLSPGTYCGGLTIQADTTFSPGLYIIKTGDLAISGNGVNVTANGVTFLLTGKGAGLTITTTGNLTVSPASAADAGQFAGFAFFLDQSVSGYLAQSKIDSATMTVSGVIYLTGQQLIIEKSASLTVNPGSIIAGFILPDNGTLSLTGSMAASTSAEIAMRKSSSVYSKPVLVR